MEINLTKIFNLIASPFVWLFKQFQKFGQWLTGDSSSAQEQDLFLSHSRINRAKSRYFQTTNTWKKIFNRKRTGLFQSKLQRDQQSLKRVKLIRLAAFSMLALVILGMIGFFVAFAYFSRDLPQPGQVVRHDGFSTKFFDRNNQLLYDLFVDQKRTPVKLDQLPDNLVHATVAIEDRDFYRHQGFDILTVLRIPYNLLIKQRIVGGSTLTQQLVKNVLLTNERTVSRKFKELVLAIQIERTFSKDEILEMYLNEVPYGGTSWGAVSAAELYFNKSASDLSLLESAFLAGLPQRPSVYSPYSGKVDDDGNPYWQARTRGVLQKMLEENYITKEQYDEAISRVNDLTFEKGAFEIKAPHFVFYVKDQLEEMFGEEVVVGGGLRVTTSLDSALQETAQQIVTDEVEAVESLHITNGSAVIINPTTGEVLAMVGSRNFFDNEKGGQFNVATSGLRQPGSSIKPVTYLALLRKGYTPASMLVDAPTDFRTNETEKPYTPKNYTGKFLGPVSIRNSLGNSLNIPAVKALALVGVEDFLNLAYDMGLESLAPTQENLSRFGLALTLGGGEVKLLDMAAAYSAFANSGTKVEPVAILKVEDRDGNVLYEYHQVEGKRVMSEGEAFLINHILSDDNARAIAFGTGSLLNLGASVAVKTGTTNDMIDNWTVGWNESVLVGTWVGNNDNSPMLRVASGISGASPIWRKIMLAAIDAGYQGKAWEPPDTVQQVEVDVISGFPAHDEFPKRVEYVIKNTLPSLPDPIHQKVKVCRGENKLATEALIAQGNYEEREVIDLRRDDPISQDGKNRWLEGINTWIASQSDGRYSIPTEFCGNSNDVSVQLEKPHDRDEFSEENIEVIIKAGSDAGIERIELWVNGEQRETIENSRYEGKIKLKAGQHELYAKAFSLEGKEAKSNVVKIGTGGQPWEKPEPTATPQPTVAPTPIPTTLPSVIPTPKPTETD